MLECLVLGDSIAVGTALHRQECVALAIEGLNSRAWNERFAQIQLRARAAVLSLGTNDAVAFTGSSLRSRPRRARWFALRSSTGTPSSSCATRAATAFTPLGQGTRGLQRSRASARGPARRSSTNG